MGRKRRYYWIVALPAAVLLLAGMFETWSGATENNEVNIFYTNDVAGYLEPCG